MQLVEQHIIKRSNSDYKEIMELCHKSKNLYNASLYVIRQHYFETKKYLPYTKLDTIFKETSNPDYRSLPAQTAQQTMRMVDQNFKSFFSSLKREGKHHIPNYKDKDGYYVATYTGQQVRKKDLKDGFISNLILKDSDTKNVSLKPISIISIKLDLFLVQTTL